MIIILLTLFGIPNMVPPSARYYVNLCWTQSRLD